MLADNYWPNYKEILTDSDMNKIQVAHADEMSLFINHALNSLISHLSWQDRIIARLQQPYSLDCIPVEAEFQVGQL